MQAKLGKLGWKFDALACSEMTPIPLLGALILRLGTRGMIVRKIRKGHGTDKLIEQSPFPIPCSVALIEDVTSTGGTLLRAVREIRSDGHRVIGALALISRDEGAKEALAAVGVPLEYVMTKSQVETL